MQHLFDGQDLTASTVDATVAGAKCLTVRDGDASARAAHPDFAVYGLGVIVVKAFSIITIPIYTRLHARAIRS